MGLHVMTEASRRSEEDQAPPPWCAGSWLAAEPRAMGILAKPQRVGEDTEAGVSEGHAYMQRRITLGHPNLNTNH